MTTKRQVAAFVDLDKTLCKVYLWQALFAHHIRHRFKRRTMYAFIAFHKPLWVLHRAGLLSRDLFFRWHATNLAWLVGGVSTDRGDRIWEWVLENQIIPHLRPEMLAAIKDHRGQGHRVILVSGSFAPLVDKVGAHIGAERAIATPLATKDDRYTGRIIPPLNIGTGKVERLDRFLNGMGSDIDPAASYFYTDSIVDAAVLEMIGYPVAVYPDSELARVAALRGWTVIGDTFST